MFENFILSGGACKQMCAIWSLFPGPILQYCSEECNLCLFEFTHLYEYVKNTCVCKVALTLVKAKK